MFHDKTIAASFQSDGFVAPVPILTQGETNFYATHLRRFIARYSEDQRFGDWCYVKSHLLLPWVMNLAKHPGVLDAVENLLGPNIVLWDSFIPAKPPKSKGYYGWHQDGTYWSITPLGQALTVWLALNEVDEENGAMRIIPGSHLGGQVDHVRTFHQESMLRRGQQVQESVNESTSVAISLSPGEASLHNPFVIHGSGPNHSDRWRLGIGLVYVSGSVSARSQHVESGVLLRGEPTPNGLEAETGAVAAVGASELEEYKRVTGRSSRRYADVPK